MPKLAGAHDAPVQKRGTGRSLTLRRRRAEGGIVNARLNVGFARGRKHYPARHAVASDDAFLARHTCGFNRSSTSKKELRTRLFRESQWSATTQRAKL
jgi:hypothetical protein